MLIFNGVVYSQIAKFTITKIASLYESFYYNRTYAGESQIEIYTLVIPTLECPQELRYKRIMESKIEAKIPSKYLDLLRLNKNIDRHTCT